MGIIKFIKNHSVKYSNDKKVDCIFYKLADIFDPVDN